MSMNNQQMKSDADTISLLSLKNNKVLAEYQSSPLWEEFISISKGVNPVAETTIDYVFVLSARATYLKHWVDSPNIPDTSDDFNRMRLGIDVAREVTAKRMGKSINQLTLDDIRLYGPTIIYNGLGKHNQELVKALVNSRMPTCPISEKLADYPAEKFEILDLPKDHGNTKGQFLSLKEAIKSGKLTIENTTVAIVSHAYHFPRISRMIGEHAPLNPFASTVKCLAMLVDRKFSTPGIAEDVGRELKSIPIYIGKKDLAPNPSKQLVISKPIMETNNTETVNVKTSKDEPAKETISPSIATLPFKMPQAIMHAYLIKAGKRIPIALDDTDLIAVKALQIIKPPLGDI